VGGAPAEAPADDLADRMADTAPQAAVDAEPAPGDGPVPSVPGDTLVAGRKKPQPRGRRTSSGG
jgi:hypothetical protein